MITDNEEAVQAHKEEQHRQGFRYYTNAEQSEDERYINAKYKGRPDLQVHIDNSSTTAGAFAANPYRPIFNPYTIHAKITAQEQEVSETKKRTNTNNKANETNSHISNNKKENKPHYQKSSGDVVKRKSRREKDQQARMKTLRNTTHQPREAEQDQKHTQQKQSETNYSQPPQTK
jgi:hypothetical protein